MNTIQEHDGVCVDAHFRGQVGPQRAGRLGRVVRSAVLWSAVAGLVSADVGGLPAFAAPTDLESALEPIRSRTGMPGIAAAAVRDGQIVAQGVVGVRALGDPAPVGPGDPFLIGSCAKSMLRVLVARLADAGTLSFDMTLGEALKDVPMRDAYRAVTIRQVLAHRGGIQPYTQIGPKMTPWLFQLTGTPFEQREAFTRHLLDEDLAATPGTEEVYSNAGFGIVAHIAERLAGKPWEELVREQVFAPLGMTTATIGLPTSAERPEGVRGHFHGEGGYQLVPGWREPLPPIAPAGMISCSIGDFARFAGKLALIEDGRGDGFLSAAAAADAKESMPSGGSIDGVPFFGGEGTFTAAFALWPSRGLAIVVETNGGESDEVCEATIEAVRAAVAPDAPGAPEAPAGSSLQPPPPARGGYGFMFRAVDDNLEIADVIPGSPAATAGLAKGDAIVKINGRNVSEMPPQERMDAIRRPKVSLTVRRQGKEIDVPLVRKED
jgi:D-alanyl-D-alanine carboxypeptidase